MESLNASEAKREFGEVLMKAQQHPIGINRNGKPVAVVVSATEYKEIETMRNAALKHALQQGMDDVNAGHCVDGKDLIAKLRQRINETL